MMEWEAYQVTFMISDNYTSTRLSIVSSCTYCTASLGGGMFRNATPDRSKSRKSRINLTYFYLGSLYVPNNLEKWRVAPHSTSSKL